MGAVFYSYEYLLRITPSVMESALSEHYHLNAGRFGLLSAVYYYAYVPMQIPVGILMDRYGPRRLLTLACLLCAFGTLLFAGSTMLWVAVIGRFLVGFGSAFAFVGVLKLATIWLPEDKLALVSGLAAALGTVGAMIGDNLLGYLMLNIGWQTTIIYTAAFGFVLTTLLWFTIRDKKLHQKRSRQVENFRKSFIDLALISKNKQIWINGFFGCLVYFPTTVLAEGWGIPYLIHAHGLSQTAADFSSSILFLGFTIGAPLMGFISDKIHRRKIPMFLGAIGAFLMVSILLYAPNLQLIHIQVLLFCLGLFYSAQAIVFAVARENSPKEAAGTAMAMTNMIVMLGGMFIQPLVGWILDLMLRSRLHDIAKDLTATQLGSLYSATDYRVALSIVPIGIFIAALLTFFLKETHAHSAKGH